jgi:hypothetical protein
MSAPEELPLPPGLVQLFRWPDGTCTLQVTTDAQESPIHHDREEPRLRVYVNDALVTHPSSEACDLSCDHTTDHKAVAR